MKTDPRQESSFLSMLKNMWVQQSEYVAVLIGKPGISESTWIIAINNGHVGAMPVENCWIVKYFDSFSDTIYLSNKAFSIPPLNSESV